MTSTDSRFRDGLKKDMPQMPAKVAERFEDTVSSFRCPKRRKSPVFRVVRMAAAVLVLVVLVLPNVSPTIAYAMQEIPVLGDIVRVFTVYKVDDTSGNHYRDVKIPQLEGSGTDNQVVDDINADVEMLTKEALKEYEALASDLPEAHTGLVIDYDVVTNTERWFTLRLMVYRDAGSSSVQYYFYHIDKNSGSIVHLSDLFRQDFDYCEAISGEILAQMALRHRENPNMVYWTEEESKINVAFRQISEDQNFYFNADGDLVIVFGKYEVAPGYMGCPEFTIPLQVYEEGLKSAS